MCLLAIIGNAANTQWSDALALSLMLSYATAAYSLFGSYIAIELTSAAVFLPFQSTSVGFGFEGWRAFFLYRFVATTMPLSGTRFAVRTLSGKGLPLFGRHSNTYQNEAAIRGIAEWLNAGVATESIGSVAQREWFERDDTVRRATLVLLALAFAALVSWFLATGKWH